MNWRSLGVAAAVVATQFFGTLPALAHGEEAPQPDVGTAAGGEVTLGSQTSPTSDTGVKAQGEAAKKEEPKKLPWHGTVFFVDQSASTQTVGLGGDYQSRNPTYELWYSFRPRYYFYESDTESFNVNGRFDIFHELTNSDSTTKNTEPQFGDSWFNAVYQRTLYKNESSGVMSKLSVGPRAILGTSKVSQGRGMIAQLGGFLGLSQALPLAGPKEPVFSGVTLSAGAAYTKQLNRCTTACDPSFAYTRQDTGGRSLVSDQLSGAAMVNHQVVTNVGAEFDVLEKLKFGLDYLWILQWTYPVGSQPGTVNTSTGPVQAQNVQDPQNFRVSPWFLATLDYDLIDEVGLGFGYYNYTNQLGPDGTRRNPLWSPDARFFFTVTANLDAIYETASGRKKATETASSGPASLHF